MGNLFKPKPARVDGFGAAGYSIGVPPVGQRVKPMSPQTTSIAETKRSFFSSKLGWFGLVGTEKGLTALTFGHVSKSEVQSALAHESASTQGKPFAWMEEAQQTLKEYAAGEPVDLNTIPTDRGTLTDFQSRVLAALNDVAYGETVTYADLAEKSGHPRAARAVGNFMASNPIPLVIACHRVIASGGRLGGYSAPSGLTMKEHLLQMECGADGTVLT